MTRRPAGWLRPLAGEKSEKVSKQVSKQARHNRRAESPNLACLFVQRQQQRQRCPRLVACPSTGNAITPSRSAKVISLTISISGWVCDVVTQIIGCCCRILVGISAFRSSSPGTVGLDLKYLPA